MRVTFVAVMSVDGHITRGDDPDVHAWASPEDWQHFVQLRDRHDALVMDRKSYEAVRPQPSSGLLRVVLTHYPERYADVTVPGQLEFITANAQTVCRRLRERGCQRLLVAGGSTVSRDFFAAGLVDDLYITFEPRLFATGTPLIAPASLDVRLQLEQVVTLNAQGTLLVQYAVLR